MNRAVAHDRTDHSPDHPKVRWFSVFKTVVLKRESVTQMLK